MKIVNGKHKGGTVEILSIHMNGIADGVDLLLVRVKGPGVWNLSKTSTIWTNPTWVATITGQKKLAGIKGVRQEYLG